MVWLAPSVRAVALSQSSPTPKTQELFLVVARLPVGAPEAALALALAPMAPAPLAPVASAPIKLTTVIEATTLWEKVAVTATLESWAGANARHTSAVPIWAFVRRTRVQVSPPPLTPVTVTAWLAGEIAKPALLAATV